MAVTRGTLCPEYNLSSGTLSPESITFEWYTLPVEWYTLLRNSGTLLSGIYTVGLSIYSRAIFGLILIR